MMDKVINLGGAAPGQFNEKRIGGVTECEENFLKIISMFYPTALYENFKKIISGFFVIYVDPLS